MVQETSSPHFVTLGMFIIDEFEYLDEEGRNIRTHNQLFEPQVSCPPPFFFFASCPHSESDS